MVADKFGNSPLLEAVKAGHDRVAALLVNKGAILSLEDGGSYLCKVVAESNIDLLKRLLDSGLDPNSSNYDQRTPLHVAASEGLHLVASMLLKYGADILAKDRYITSIPYLVYACLCKNCPLLVVLKKNFCCHVIQIRWGKTPLDDGRECGSKPLLKILEQAKEDSLHSEKEAGNNITKCH